MKDIVLASNNQGKLKELGAILSPLGINLIAQGEFNTPEYEETGLTFVENALGKARHAAKHCQLPAIGDDSGLCVPTLKGAPGIYSSRYAGINASDNDNISTLLDTLASHTNRAAYFYTSIVFLEHAGSPRPFIAEGLLNGEIAKEPRGDKGFGYDPIFILASENKSLAEVDASHKNTISHRAKACQHLIHLLKSQQHER